MLIVFLFFFAMAASELAIMLGKLVFFNVLRDREAQKIGTFHINANENIAHMMHWQSKTFVL